MQELDSELLHMYKEALLGQVAFSADPSVPQIMET